MTATRTADSSRSNTLAQGFPLAATYLTYIIVTPFIINRLGFESFGVWAVTGALGQYAGLLDFGLSRTVTRFVSLRYNEGDYRRERGVVGTSLLCLVIVAILSSAVGALASPLIAGPMSIGVNVAAILIVASVLIALLGLASRVIAAAAFGRQRMVAMNYVLAVSSIMWHLAGCVYLFFGTDLASFAIACAGGSALGFVTTILGFVISERRNPFGMPDISDIRELLRFGVQAQAVSIADLVVVQAPKLALGFMVGPAPAGAYEVASRIASGARSFGVMAGTALTPKLTALFADSGLAGVKSSYYRYARSMTAISVVPLVAACAGCVPFLSLWLEDIPPGTALLCIALCVAYLCNVATSMSTVTAYAVGAPGAVATSALVTAALNVLLLIVGVQLFGLNGSVVAILISLGFGTWFGPYCVGKAVAEPVLAYFRAILSPLVFGISGAAFGLVLSIAIEKNFDGTVGMILALTFGVGLAILFHFLCCSWRNCLPEIQLRRTLKGLLLIRSGR